MTELVVSAKRNMLKYSKSVVIVGTMLMHENKFPDKCPSCNSTDNAIDDYDRLSTELWMKLKCLSCGFQWIEEYKFIKWEPRT